MSRKVETTYTFAVTFKAPHNASIVESRMFLKDAIMSEMKSRNVDDAFKDLDLDTVKVHLTNKETSYGKR